MKTRASRFGTLIPSLPHMRVRRYVLILLCLLLISVILLPAYAAKAGEVKYVRVGWYDSAFNTKDANGRRSGYAYEYQMKIAAYTGWRYEYVTGSWSELMQMLIDGDIDLMSDVSYTPERAEQMLFPSLPMGEEEYYLFTFDDNREITPQDFSSLNGKKVGVNKGSIQAEYFREWVENHGIDCEIIEVTCSEEESIKMLKSGTLDGYVTVDAFVDREGLMPICKVGASDFYFAVNRNRKDLLNELDTALTLIREENRNYNELLFEKHLITTGSNAFLTVEEREWLEEHGTIRIGYQDNYMAFCATDPDTGKLTGALKDYLELAEECVANAHVEFEPIAYPTAADAIEALRNGDVDCVFPANLTAGDGERMGLFMTPALMCTDVFAIVRQADYQIISEREHIIVAVNNGNPNYESCLQDNYPDWHIVYYPTTEECLKAVADSVADCVLISSYRFNNIARLCDKLHLIAAPTNVELDYCFAVSAGQPKLYSILSKLAGLVPTSSMDTALSRYVAEDAKTTLTDLLSEHMWMILGIAGGIVLAILALLLRSLHTQWKSAKLISATEKDELTNLYNRDYFLEYAGRMCREHPNTPMDAVVVNIDRFHSVNALNGRGFGNRVLRTLGNEIRSVTNEKGGIAGRFEADRFDMCYPHSDDYHEVYERLQKTLNAMTPAADIRLRMGVMPSQMGVEPVQMFDRARTACAIARENFQDKLVVFDEKMQERESYEQRLLGDMRRALDSYEFEVYFQPQYNIQSDPPKLASAEALIRWNHPELGMIAPNDFIPLFERNGKIGEVDRYVWAEAVRQIARWRDTYGIMIPVSVNLSRIDVFDPELEGTLDRVLEYHGLTRGALKLEVTESAYTGNADQVIRVVEGLRNRGYEVEMDDFGSGYSSLNMLSTMPVDVLKMDRVFIRNLSENDRDAKLVALILDIAKCLKIPVVAEGVETEEQLKLLKDLGCELVQGFYFSRPLPPEEFEEKVIRKEVAAGNGTEKHAEGKEM